MTRLTNELESVYVEERRDALDKLQAEHIEELRALTNRYTANEEELRAEVPKQLIQLILELANPMIYFPDRRADRELGAEEAGFSVAARALGQCAAADAHASGSCGS